MRDRRRKRNREARVVPDDVMFIFGRGIGTDDFAQARPFVAWPQPQQPMQWAPNNHLDTRVLGGEVYTHITLYNARAEGLPSDAQV